MNRATPRTTPVTLPRLTRNGLSILPPRGHQWFYLHRQVQGIFFLRRLDVALAIFRQQETFFDQFIDGAFYNVDICLMTWITLFNRQTRIAVLFALGFGAGEGFDAAVGHQ